MAGTSRSLSVKVIVHDQHGHVLLLQRSQASKDHAGKWEFPGGKVDPGESLELALLREVQEETGLAIKLKGSFGVCESKRAEPPVVHLVMEAEAEETSVRLSDEHEAFQWVAPGKLEEIQLCPQFRRIARRYAQEVALEPRVKPQDTMDGKIPLDRFKNWVVTPDSLSKDLAAFLKARPCFEALAAWLKKLLSAQVHVIVPMAEVTARAKDPVSFAAKLISKNKYKDPLCDMTDLVGARIVVHLPEEVDAVCRWVEANFEIDKANSGDKLRDLGTEKFGYRSVHYVVETRPGKPAGIPDKLLGLKAEIQVRTIAQHAWADIGHDRVYKADCDIPEYWKREANRIAALLEAADDAFARLVQGVSLFQNYTRQSPDEESAQRQIALWDVVRAKLVDDPRPAQRTARLALEIQDWNKAERVVDEYKGKPDAHLLCSRGYALCKRATHSPAPEWAHGIELLEEATRIAEGYIEPHLRLGELLAPEKLAQALTHYEQAFAIDSSNPSALVGYIRCKVLDEKTVAFMPLLRPEIELAITRSEELATAGADLPHALYRIAGFHMLLGSAHAQESLELLARAVHQTLVAPGPLLQALRDISQLAEYAPDRPDIECARRFLAAALLAKFPKQPWPKDVDKPDAQALQPRTPAEPVVIVAGGCDAYHESAMKNYAELLTQAFADFRGTVISGGTKQGISGLVGELAEESGGRIRPVGYLPPRLPHDGTATRDTRYDRHGEIRQTDGAADEDFSARQPIQNWLDLLAGGIYPSQVRLLGINGGNIAGLEYRIAVALGAQVGVIEGSGREAERVIDDWPAKPLAVTKSQDHDREQTSEDEHTPGRLMPLPPDPATLRAFLHMGIGRPKEVSQEAVAGAARLVHQDFLEQQRYSHPDPVMQPWPKLRSDLKASNEGQIEYLVSILRASGFGVRPCEGVPADPKFTDDEIRTMGEMEHGRWNAERLQSGWRYAKKKDSQKKLSPHLVPWKELDEDTRKWDFLNVRLWPEILAEVGYQIIRLSDAPQSDEIQ